MRALKKVTALIKREVPLQSGACKELLRWVQEHLLGTDGYSEPQRSGTAEKYYMHVGIPVSGGPIVARKLRYGVPITTDHPYKNAGVRALHDIQLLV